MLPVVAAESGLLGPPRGARAGPGRGILAGAGQRRRRPAGLTRRSTGCRGCCSGGACGSDDDHRRARTQYLRQSAKRRAPARRPAVSDCDDRFLRAGGARSGCSRSPSTSSSARWRTTTICGRCRSARRAACSSIATGRCSSKTGIRRRSRSSASRSRISTRRSARSSRIAGLDEQACARRGQPSPPRAVLRPIEIVEDASIEQLARIRAHMLELPGSGDAIRCRRAGIRRRMARICSDTSVRLPSAQLARNEVRRPAERGDRRSGRHRAGLQPGADGT